MTLEAVNAIASIGTFVVIAATAIAAIVQLRHMRASNQITAINEVRHLTNSDSFTDARTFIVERLPELVKDPEFRKRMYLQPTPTDLRALNTFADAYEMVGSLVKNGLLDKDVVCDLFAWNVVGGWRRLAPVTSARRHVLGSAVWENFEYLAGLSQTWLDRYAAGSLPRNARRMPVDDPYYKADVAAGLAPRWTTTSHDSGAVDRAC